MSSWLYDVCKLLTVTHILKYVKIYNNSTVRISVIIVPGKYDITRNAKGVCFHLTNFKTTNKIECKC